MIDNLNKGNSNQNNKEIDMNSNLLNKPSSKNDKKYQKLVYRIADVTSEEDGYPVSELLNHTPYSRGWQSARYAEFPQEIILEFGQTVRIKQIQFLSHQYKISKKIELLIFNPAQSKKFKKIGYLSLDSNERSNYQARELKSVYIDHNCQKIKVILHSSWENNHNLFRQVGLISINVQGEYENKINDFNIKIDKFEENKNAKNEGENTFEDNIKYDPLTLNKLKNLNAIKDDAIAQEDYDTAANIKNAINRLKSVANQLLALEERKQIAIKNEQFDQAKVLKIEIDSLRNEVSNIDSNQEQKQSNTNNYNNDNRAASNGNNMGFNKLKKINSNNNNQNKDETNFNNKNYLEDNNIDSYDNNLNNNLRLKQNTNQGSKTPAGKDMNSNLSTKNKFDNYLQENEMNNSNKPNDLRNNIKTPQNQTNLGFDSQNNYSNKTKTNSNFNNLKQNPNKQASNFDTKAPLDVDNIVVGGNNQNFDDLLNEKMKEEKLNKKNDKQQKQQNAQNEDNADNDDIPEKEYPIAEPFIGIFSYEYVKLLFSKTWKKKEEGVKLIEKEITKYPKSSIINNSTYGPESVAVSALGVAEYILSSSLAQPCLASMDLLKTVLTKFKAENLNKFGNVKQDFINKAEKIVGLLLEKTADANPKLKEKAEISINELADSPLIGSKVVLNHLVTGKVKKSLANSAKHLMSRLNLLNRNIDLYGLNSIDDLDAFVNFAVTGYKNPNKDVRDSAFNLLMNIYRFIGEDVKKYFKDLRPAQVSALEEGFDSVEIVGNSENNNNKQQPNKNLGNNKAKSSLNNKQLNKSNSGSLERPKSENPGKNSANAKNDNRRKSIGKKLPEEKEFPEEPQNYENMKEYDQEENYDDQNFNNNNLQCDFCGYMDPELNEDTLALHLYKGCPWLTSCFKCKQTVEICTLNSHYINECQGKKDFRVCSRCKEPIHAKDYEKHVNEKSCVPAKNQNVANRCPLCHTDVSPAGKNGWTLHLLEEGCPKNPRGRY